MLWWCVLFPKACFAACFMSCGCWSTVSEKYWRVYVLCSLKTASMSIFACQAFKPTLKLSAKVDLRYLFKYSSKSSSFTARKTIFSFSRRPEKMVFPEKLHWNIIFLVLSGKMIFLFPKNIILHPRWKMKDDLSQKIHRNTIFSSNFLKRWSFQKRPCWDMIFLVLSGKMVFFSRKHDIFSLGIKWETTFLKKNLDIWYFLCTVTGVRNVAPRPSVKKKNKKIKDGRIPQKYT